MPIRIKISPSLEGYVSLSDAADEIGLSAARTRHYVSEGRLEHTRDARNRIYVSEASIDKFLASPPTRGAPGKPGEKKKYPYMYRPAGVQHIKGALREVRSRVEDSPEKTTAIAVLKELLEALVDEWHSQGESVEEQGDIFELEE